MVTEVIMVIAWRVGIWNMQEGSLRKAGNVVHIVLGSGSMDDLKICVIDYITLFFSMKVY